MTPALKVIPISETGYLRLVDIIGDRDADPPIPAIIPIGRTTWFEWIERGDAPKPVKVGTKMVFWKSEDIRALIERLDRENRWGKGRIRRKGRGRHAD